MPIFSMGFGTVWPPCVHGFGTSAKKKARIRSGAIIFGDLFDKPCDKYRPRGRPDRRPDNALRKTNHARPDPIAIAQTHPSLESKGHQSGTSIHACNKYHPRSHMLVLPFCKPITYLHCGLPPSLADKPRTAPGQKKGPGDGDPARP